MGRVRRMLRTTAFAGFCLPLAALVGCATAFSAGAIRDEIVRQTGTEPQKAFELDLGGPTLHVVRSVMAGDASPSDLPLAGLERLELAVYDVSGSAGAGRGVDFTRMPVHGWEKVVRTTDGARSAVVLVRRSGSAIAELVVAAAGPRSAIYGRLEGRLDPDLPEALGEAVRATGVEGVRDALMSVGTPEGQAPSEGH